MEQLLLEEEEMDIQLNYGKNNYLTNDFYSTIKDENDIQKEREIDLNIFKSKINSIILNSENKESIIIDKNNKIENSLKLPIIKRNTNIKNISLKDKVKKSNNNVRFQESKKEKKRPSSPGIDIFTNADKRKIKIDKIPKKDYDAKSTCKEVFDKKTNR